MILEHHHVEFRRVERGRNAVVGKGAVGHRAITHHHAFEQRIAESLHRPPFDLSLCQCRVNWAAKLLNGGDFDWPHFEGVAVQLNFRDIAPPRIGGVRIADVMLLIPANPVGSDVLFGDRQRAMSREILRRRERAQLLLELLRASLEDLAYDHTRS